MIYIEYYSRRPEIDLAEFHQAVRTGMEGWDESFNEDQLVWSVARTWRIGPLPEHIGVWYSPKFGFERIDDWESIFRAGEADSYESPFLKVARIEAAGCYEPLLEPVRVRNGSYYAEFFRGNGETAAIRNFYLKRAKQHPRLKLNLLVHRIGRLVPQPGGLAVWSFANVAALKEIASGLDGVTKPVQLEAAGTYADVGKQIL